MRVPWRALLICAALAGCGGGGTFPITSWVLSVDGRRATVPVELPTRLDDGRVPDEPLRYQLRSSVTVPAEWRGRPLQLVLPDLAAVTHLRVDGAAAIAVSSATEGYRRRGPHAWSIPAAAASDGVVELELVVEHTWTQSAWWGTVPRLLPADATDAAATRVYIFNLLASAAALVALLQVALTSLTVYVSDRRRRVYLPFGVQALIAAFYPLFVAGWSQSFLGTYDTTALALALALACMSSIHFTHEMFGLGRPWRGYRWLCAASCVVSAVFNQPFIATRVAGIATILFVSLIMLSQVTTCARLLRSGGDRRSALYSLLSWLTLVVTGLPDFVWWLGGGDLLGGVRLASIGLALFAVFLSLLLSQKHVSSLKQSDNLNAELGRRVDQLELRRHEIELLNQELRRQIADRASQIYAAVALAKTRGVTAQLAVGDLVQGRYRVERPIGSGGMGTIYEVTRLNDGRKLALKLPREVHGESLARLAREAQIASTLAHPNIVAIVDVDVASAGFLFLVMELVEGTSLTGHRDRFGDVRWAMHVLAQIADGLAALHRVGIIHRDLKPANVLVTSSTDPLPQIKITDFGISLHAESELSGALAAAAPHGSDEALTQKLPSSGPTPQAGPRARIPTSSFLTRTGHLPGTPLYMAPELIEGRKVLTSAADLFSFGVIAQELLTGHRPYTEAPVLAMLEHRAVPVAASISDRWRACPDHLARALDACLSIDPLERPTAAEMEVVLKNILAAEPPLGHAQGAAT